MQEFIANLILWTLALYGLIEIAKLIRYCFACTKFKEDGIYVIIAVKNQEDKIECFTRNLICKLRNKKEELPKDIIMVDLESEDDTYKIISKLSKDYEFIKASEWSECRNIMDEISK